MTGNLSTSWDKRENVRILVIGAGGIGCEVLKNLVLSGFRKISVLDMDRIDVSNLNRQFLFNKSDVGSYKADTAAKAVRNYVQDDAELNLTVYRVMVQDLPLETFRQQDLIISALDNVEARKFVNNMCLTCEIPLMEAGSTGKNGQGYCLFSKAGTECFECRDQPKVTGYPVCTIRLTAEKPEHCVAWARYLFESIFAPKKALDDTEVNEDDNALTDLADHIYKLRASDTSSEKSEFAKKVAIYLFDELITSYLELKETGDKREENPAKHKLPEPHKWLSEISVDPTKTLDSSASDPARKIQSKEYYAEQFMLAIERCLVRYGGQCVKFDKDEEEIMAFVASAANLRMMNFHIPMMNAWDLKTMAGAIQPAIASTNAIVAAIEVMNVIRLCPLMARAQREPDFKLDLDALNEAGLRFVWTRAEALDGRLLLAEKLDAPRPACLVCSNAAAIVSLDKFSNWPMSRFVKEILELRLGGKDVMVMNAKSILYDVDTFEDCPSIGDRLFEGKSELISISWLGLGACDMVVQEEEADPAPGTPIMKDGFRIVKALPDHALTKDAWKVETEVEKVTDIDAILDHENVERVEKSFGGKRPRSVEDHESAPLGQVSKTRKFHE